MSVSYGHTKTLQGKEFQVVLDTLTEALKAEGFGILTEIDVKETLKKKIDVDFRQYKILGACNPPLAHKALSQELFIGLLLPCNIIVFEEDDGRVTVSIGNPKEMFKIVDNEQMEGIAEDVNDRMLRVLEKLN